VAGRSRCGCRGPNRLRYGRLLGEKERGQAKGEPFLTTSGRTTESGRFTGRRYPPRSYAALPMAVYTGRADTYSVGPGGGRSSDGIGGEGRHARRRPGLASSTRWRNPLALRGRCGRNGKTATPAVDTARVGRVINETIGESVILGDVSESGRPAIPAEKTNPGSWDRGDRRCAQITCHGDFGERCPRWAIPPAGLPLVHLSPGAPAGRTVISRGNVGGICARHVAAMGRRGELRAHSIPALPGHDEEDDGPGAGRNRRGGVADGDRRVFSGRPWGTALALGLMLASIGLLRGSSRRPARVGGKALAGGR